MDKFFKIFDSKIFMLLGSAGLLVIVGAFALLAIGFATDDGTESYLDEDEKQIIRDMFDCDRATLEYRETDKYCDNPELYEEDLQKGLVEQP